MSDFPVMPWHEAADHVSRCIFAIETTSGTGTGFGISITRPTPGRTGSGGLVIGTAWHVIADLYGHAKKGDIKLIRWKDKIDITEKCESIAIVPVAAKQYDTGIIVCTSNEDIFDANDLLPVLPNESMLARGAEVSWMGFPGLVYPELCFFNGHVSGYVTDPPAYLIDGVAINGVSGGPVFDNRKHLIGFVSAYIPNRVSEHLTLPGLCSIVPISFIRYFLENNLNAKDMQKEK